MNPWLTQQVRSEPATMAWLEESLARDARAVPAELLSSEPQSAAEPDSAGFASVFAADASTKQGSACSPLASAVLIRVTTEADFKQRRLYPPSTTVILELQNHVTLKRGLLFGPKYACTILRSGGGAKGRGYRLYVHRVDEPILRIWNTSNVIVYRVQMSQPFRAYSKPCPREIPDVGTDIICPLIHVYRSYGVQIVKGYTFGRVDVIRTMHSRIDSMKMTAVSDFKRGNGVIRVMLSGYGPLLVRCYVYVTNNEIYGAYLPVLFQFGVVGAVFKNNHVHDYVWAAITCGNMVHLQGDCMLTSISNNLVVAKGRNLTGGGDATGIYYVTHWNNPGNLAECNYIIGGDHCYYLDYASSGVTIRGGACIGTVDGMKVNNGKWNRIQHVVMKGTELTPGWCACLTVTVCNCLKDPGNYWDRMQAKYYSSAPFQQVGRVPLISQLGNLVAPCATASTTPATTGTACEPSNTVVPRFSRWAVSPS
ncbi:unnamed protein product [Closterium sp. NIES-65]|nr:unnamed protein product [Closterium sp. NIES-65]